MTLEKVSFVYPVLIREGTPAFKVHAPELWMHKNDLPSVESIEITVGVFLIKSKPYYMEVDIFFGDESVIEAQDEGDESRKMAHVSVSTAEKQHIEVSSMVLKRVVLPGEGVYKIVATLLSGEIDDSKIIDVNESYFIVTSSKVEGE
ncbi:hypothetical protein [Photorhabdus viridis]|uniref:hypothetical protein n=1 Tax=Photorhabdus viridis TaxID=3163327 RepID=UPI003307AF80